MTVQKKVYEDLHRALVTALTVRITDGEATAADMNVARQLLKDSGMDFVEKNYDTLKQMSDLPFPADHEASTDFIQ